MNATYPSVGIHGARYLEQAASSDEAAATYSALAAWLEERRLEAVKLGNRVAAEIYGDEARGHLTSAKEYREDASWRRELALEPTSKAARRREVLGI